MELSSPECAEFEPFFRTNTRSKRTKAVLENPNCAEFEPFRFSGLIPLLTI
jgi:hypothetical protein